MVCFDSIIPMEDPEIDSSDDHPYDPIKKYPPLTQVSGPEHHQPAAHQQARDAGYQKVLQDLQLPHRRQHLPTPLPEQQGRREVHDPGPRRYSRSHPEINISLKLANLQFVYEPFKRIISFMNTLTEMNLGHFHRLLKEYRHKEMVIENMKDKTNPRAPKTLGIIDNEELKRMKRMQIQEEEREKYNKHQRLGLPAGAGEPAEAPGVRIELQDPHDYPRAVGHQGEDGGDLYDD